MASEAQRRGAKNLMKDVFVCLKAKKHGFKIMPLLKENQ